MNQIELLAPAKDLECGIAAINCGADAVYIGAPKFGAREAVGNSLEDIAVLVSHAHKYWAKVYTTVNTLLYDMEILEAVRQIKQLYEIGIDGLIIQDMGLLECDLPPLPLIASTQMHNNSPEKVAFLEKVGFQRAILARELDLDQIRKIRQQTSIELEVFIHGALCVCYSGQCYLSYALGGRSGNRGQCAQPCRKIYSLTGNQVIHRSESAVRAGVGEESKLNLRSSALNRQRSHWLSLRDLCLSGHLRELLEVGVCSFKIEGRLKDKAYVSNVVAYYRKELDILLKEMNLQKSSSGKSRIDFTPDLSKTFNRGYTGYFLKGQREPIGSIETPKMMGEPVGKVMGVRKREIRVETNLSLHPGDGLCFFDKNHELRGTVINAVKNTQIVVEKSDGIRVDTLLYRNHDHRFLTQLLKSRPERRIGVHLALRETRDGLTVIATDEDGNTAEYVQTGETDSAEKPDHSLESIRKQLAKTGETEFSCVEVRVEIEPIPFMPISTLNTLRRGVLEALRAVREKKRPVARGGVLRNEVPYPEPQLSYLGNVLNRKAEAFYRRHGVTDIEPAAESGLDMRNRKLMTTRYCLRHQLNQCPGDGAEPLFLTDTAGHQLELRFDCRACQMEVYLNKQ